MERRRSSASLGVTSPCRLGSTSSAIKTETFNTSWLNDFTVEGTIGRGKFAVVKKCLEKSTGQQFAAKCIRRRRHNRDCTPDILHEIAVLEMGMKHPHLISLHRVYETSSEFVLILEYAAGGEIFDHCVGVKDTFNEHTTRRLMIQILDAVGFLHDNDIVHLDLKPQNILLSKNGSEPDSNIKLVDFGLSKYIAAGLEVREILGTPDYVAPEVLNYEPISTATDVWSLGVVAYVMLTGVSPFLGETKQETLMNVTTALLDFPSDLFDNLSSSCRDFIIKMLQRDPIDRSSTRQSMLHPWITGRSSPYLSLENKSHEDGEHEEVFVNGTSSSPATSPSSDDGSVTSCIENPSPDSSSSKETEGTKSQSINKQESDVDYNGNLVDEGQEAATHESFESDTSGTQGSFNESSTSVDSEDTVSQGMSHPKSLPLKNSQSAPPFSAARAKRTEYNSCVEHSPTASPKIINLTLRSNVPTSPAQKMLDETQVPSTGGTCVDCEETDLGVEPLPSYFTQMGSSVDPDNDDASGISDANVHATDPCLKRRKFDYCAGTEQNSTEISVAD